MQEINTEHIKSITKKISTTMGLVRKFQQFCQGQPFLPYIKLL